MEPFVVGVSQEPFIFLGCHPESKYFFKYQIFTHLFRRLKCHFFTTFHTDFN